jgi:hypothetical protein
MHEAWQSLVDLEHFVGDRLAHPQNLTRYTRTAMAFLGEVGLKKRGAWTRRVVRLVNDPREPNWVGAFARWRIHVDRALDPAPTPPGTDDDQLLLYAEGANSDTRWVLHDPTTCYAALTDPLDAVDRETLDLVLNQLSHAARDTGQIRIAMVPQRPIDVAALAWVEDHELFPELAIFPGSTLDEVRTGVFTQPFEVSDS